MEITPRDYRLRAVIGIVAGVVLLGVSVAVFVVQDGLFNPVVGIAALVYGIYCARRARAQVTQPVLRIDRDGVHAQDGEFERRWGGVVMVWVGSQTAFRLPFVAQPVLSFFTVAGVDFARRAGLPPTPLYTIAVGGHHQIPDLCHRLRALTTADVVDGTRVSRREAAAALGSGSHTSADRLTQVDDREH